MVLISIKEKAEKRRNFIRAGIEEGVRESNELEVRWELPRQSLSHLTAGGLGLILDLGSP